MRNEHTSTRVAYIAGKVLAMLPRELASYSATRQGKAEIRSLAASCLTQAADKLKRSAVPKTKAKKAKAKP